MQEIRGQGRSDRGGQSGRSRPPRRGRPSQDRLRDPPARSRREGQHRRVGRREGLRRVFAAHPAAQGHSLHRSRRAGDAGEHVRRSRSVGRFYGLVRFVGLSERPGRALPPVAAGIPAALDLAGRPQHAEPCVSGPRGGPVAARQAARSALPLGPAPRRIEPRAPR